MHSDESLARSNRIDEICDKFEERILAGDSPRIEDILQKHFDVDKTRLLRELLLIEFEVRRRRGDTITAADYASRFPDQTEIVDDALSTILSNPKALTETVDVSISPADETYVPDGSEVEATLIPDSPQPPKEADADGKQFGDYELLHEIARGGMGVVYKARQLSLNRIVAIKMIRSGELAGEDEIQRFHTEAEAAAQLDHPNIVPIHEVGEQNGLHFFSMGFVDGKGLDAQLKEGPLPPREAAELIKTIAEAIQYAHDKGIVHRDLKPANVLIDADGKPRITDFGLAKNIAGDSGMTATGQVMGTPSYMPPEQAAGQVNKIGPLSDVYSLGAMLYAALTGRPPFQAASVMETLKQVLEKEPVSPRPLNPAVERDLETICLKCLEKDAEKRYASAQGLVDELQRFLTHKPILARPVSRWERSVRWCKRNPLGATVVGLIVFLAIAGPALAVHQIETNRQLDSALEGEKDATAKAQKKEQETAAALAKVKVALTNEQAALQRKDKALLETENSIDAYVDVVKNSELLRDPNFKPLLKKLLKDALAHYERFIEEHKDEQDEATRARLAKALFGIGFISEEKGSPQKAIQAFRQSIMIREQLAREHPTVKKYQNGLASAQLNLGNLYTRSGQMNEALAAYQQAAKVWRQLALAYPSMANYASRLASIHNNIGGLHANRGKTNEALKEFRKSLQIKERLADENPTVVEFQRDLAASHNNIAIIYRQLGMMTEALAAYRQAIKIQKSLLRKHPQVRDHQTELSGSYINLGVLFRKASKTVEALEAQQEALAILETLVRENPTVTEFQDRLSNSHYEVGSTYSEMGKPTEALAAYQLALKIREQITRENPTIPDYKNTLAEIHCSIGALHIGNGKADDAETAYWKALQISEILAREHPKIPAYHDVLARSHYGLGHLYHQKGQLTNALDSFAKALKTRERLAREYPMIPEYQKHFGSSYNSIGVFFHKTKKPADALMAHQLALKIRETLTRNYPKVPEYQSDLAASYNNIGVLSLEKGNRNAGLSNFQKARRIRDQLTRQYPTVTQYHIDLANSHSNIGLVFEKNADMQNALAAYEQSQLIRKKLVDDHPTRMAFRRLSADGYNSIGILHNKFGDPLKALPHATQSIALLQSAAKRDRFARDILIKSYVIRATSLDSLARHYAAARDWFAAMKLDRGEHRIYFGRRTTLSLARSGRHQKATELAAQLERAKLRPSSVFDLARVYGVSVRAADLDEELSLTTRHNTMDSYSAKALAQLKRIATTEYFTTSPGRRLLYSDKDLNALRHRDDFRDFARSVGVELPAWAVKPRSARLLWQHIPVVASKPKSSAAQGAKKSDH